MSTNHHYQEKESQLNTQQDIKDVVFSLTNQYMAVQSLNQRLNNYLMALLTDHSQAKFM
jgi:hypothetical protein